MKIKCSLFRMLISLAGNKLPPDLRNKFLYPDPSVSNTDSPIPSPVKVDLSNTAPAPSPNNTQVFRLSKSIMLDILSAPITSTVSERPDSIIAAPAFNAYKNPEQADITSKHQAFLMFSNPETMDAVEGN